MATWIISAFGIRHLALTLDAEAFRIPRQAQLRRRGHVPDERGGRHDRGTREVAFAAESHAVLPVAVERRDGALPGRERVGPLAEAGAAPRLADVAADRAEDLRNRLAAQPRVGLLDLAADAARSREDLELAIDLLRARRARRAQDERRLQQIVVAAVGARSDHRLVEGDPLAR